MEINQHNNSFTALNRKAAEKIIFKRVTNPEEQNQLEHMFEYLKKSPNMTVIKPVKGSSRRLEADIYDGNGNIHNMKEGRFASMFSPKYFIQSVADLAHKFEK